MCLPGLRLTVQSCQPSGPSAASRSSARSSSRNWRGRRCLTSSWRRYNLSIYQSIIYILSIYYQLNLSIANIIYLFICKKWKQMPNKLLEKVLPIYLSIIYLLSTYYQLSIYLSSVYLLSIYLFAKSESRCLTSSWRRYYLFIYLLPIYLWSIYYLYIIYILSIIYLFIYYLSIIYILI